MKATIQFGPLAPDRSSFKNPGVLAATNVIPHEPLSYGPLRTLTETGGTALNATCIGATCLVGNDSDGEEYTYAGTADKLYRIATPSSNPTDKSKVGGYTGTYSSNVWEFAQWKANVIIATNYADAVQAATISGAGGTFADMITSTLTPKARHIGVIGNFVVLGNTNDATDGTQTARVWWSAFGDNTDFDPDAATQCDYEDLATGGPVQKVVGGRDYGYIIQRDGVRSMRYVGAGTVFDLFPVNDAPGTAVPGSVIAHQGRVFYLADGGFYALSGGSAQPIGTSYIDHLVADQIVAGTIHKVWAAVDPDNKLVVWSYDNASGGTLSTRLLFYKWDEGRWSEAEVDTEVILSIENELDESRDLAAFNSSHKLSLFSGATMAATITTADFTLAGSQRTQINSIRPLVEGDNAAQMSLAQRARLGDAVSFGTTSAANLDGLCNFRSAGRYHRARCSITSSTSWSHITGLEIDAEVLGER